MPKINIPSSEAGYVANVDLYRNLSATRLAPSAAPLPDLSTLPRYIRWSDPPASTPSPTPPSFTTNQNADLQQYMHVQPRRPLTPTVTTPTAPVLPDVNADLQQYMNIQRRPSNPTVAPAPATPPPPVLSSPSTPSAQPPATAERLSSPASSFGQGLRNAAPASGAAAAITFGAGLISGANPVDAGFQAVGAGLGTGLGAAAGGATGPAAPIAVPLLSAAGGLAGAAAGGRIADLLFDDPEPSPRAIPEFATPPSTAPFTGGQCAILYTVTARTVVASTGQDTLSDHGRIFGPILGARAYYHPNSNSPGAFSTQILCHGTTFLNNDPNFGSDGRRHSTPRWINIGGASGGIPFDVTYSIVSVTAEAGLPDNCGSPPPAPSPLPSPTNITNNYVVQGSPTQAPLPSLPLFAEPETPQRLQLGLNLAPASADPTNQQKPNQPYVLNLPQGQPVTISKPGFPPFTFTPTEPSILNLPSNLSEPKLSSPLSESATPSDTPLSLGSATTTPQQFTLPGTGSVTVGIPGHQPIAFDPTGQTQPQGVTPDLLIPNTFTPTPLTPGPPLTSPPLTTTPLTPAPTIPTTTPIPASPLITNQQIIIDSLLALGLIAKGIQANTTPKALQTAAANGTCSTLQPGGCMAPVAENAQKANNNIIAANANINDLSDTIGKTEYPVLVPSTFITDKINPNPPMQTIPNLTSFMGWQTRRIDELFGQFSVPLEFKPSPNLPGVSKEIPNVAEGIGEIYGSQLHAATQLQTMINLQTRTLIEVGQNKQQIFKNYMMTQSIMDYLGFAYSEKNHQVPMLFKPGEGDLFSMLTEHNQEIKGIETKKGESLRKDLQKLLEAAAIIKGIFWRKIDTKGTAKEVQDRVTDNIKKSSKLNRNINEKEVDEQGKDKFDKFVDGAEVAFKDTPGITNTTEPYGDSFENRPNIKRLPKPTPKKP